ncbi:MAG TPA: amidohydrolase [Vicinamibacteria bacterium]|nr:amidohydrolase [Vicinamibacteria bacterium]
MRFKFAVAVAVFASALHAASAPQPAADLLLDGAAVFTMDAARSRAEAVAVRDGRIVFVGTSANGRAFAGPKTRVLKLVGRMLLPGFQDAHVHPVSGGVELLQCNLNDLLGRDAILAKVRECAKDMAGKPWIAGGGWDVGSFSNGNPSRLDLDAIAPDKPVLLSASDGHSSWANSKALELAGVNAKTPDPKNGRIERDAAGNPTGTLREDASDLVSRLVPKSTDAERLDGLRRALRLFAEAGVTALQEASAGTGAEGGGARPTLDTYLEAEKRGELTVRVTVALGTDPLRGPEQVDELVALRRDAMSARVRPIAAKIFADGVIEPRTAAMLEPYLDRPGYRGEPNWSPAALDAIVARLAEAGFNVHIHAVGDRAVRLSLDAFEAARPKARGRDLRHQIAHLQIVDPQDFPRFKQLDVIANFQALWAYADTWMVDLTWPAIPKERWRYIYPIGSMVRAGARLALGSDWSVSSLKPLDAIQVALTRQWIVEPREEPMFPNEAIDLGTALAGYTIGSAYANGLEKDTGSIEVGKAADLVVVERNLFEVKPAEIAKQKVLLTLVDGKPVHRDPALAW